MIRSTLSASLVAGLVSLVAVPPTWALTWTCETVVAKNEADPLGGLFRSRFDEPAVNGSGDVVFYAKAKKAKRRLYHYPGAGAPEVVAAQDGAAPGGGTFRKFRNPSINDAGDIGFFGDLAAGEGVFVREAGMPIVAAARTSDPAPGGGAFDRFRAVSRVNDDGDIAFYAEVTGGADGVYLFDVSASTVSAAAVVGDATGDGREFCSFFRAVGLGDSGKAAVHASTETTCGVSGDPLASLYLQDGGGSFVRVALKGDATPIAGTTYNKFFGDPLVNAADKVLFRSKISGVLSVKGLFLFDDPTTSTVVLEGDAAPVSGGSLRSIAPSGGLTDADQAGFRARMVGGATNQGVFLFDGVDEPVVLKSDAVPTDKFGPGSIYRKLFEPTGFDRAGTWATYAARLRDTAIPRRNAGLFRCEGT